MRSDQPKGFFDYILLFWSKKWLIIVVFFGVSILTTIITLFIPELYRSKTVILPTSQQSVGGISSLFQNLPAGLQGLSGGIVNGQSANYLAILNSRTFKEVLIERFNLIHRYGSKNIEFALNKLNNRMEVSLNDDGSLSIAIYDEVPDTVAAMANFAVEVLDSLNRKLNTQKARSYRQFIENRYERNKSELAEAEVNLKKLQERTGVVDIEVQSQATISTYTDLEKTLLQFQVEEKGLSSQVSNNNPQLKLLQNQINFIQTEQKKLVAQDTISDQNILVAFKNIPELGLKYLRAKRELEIQQRIQEFILPQFEKAKLEEMQNTPTVQVVDKARVPIKDATPRALYVLVAGFLGIVFTLVYILVKDNLDSYYRNN